MGLGSRRPALAPRWIAVLVLGVVVFSLLVWSGHRRIANAVGVGLLFALVAASRSLRRR